MDAKAIMTTCETCRYWSSRLAQSIGCGPVEAYCLSDDSPFQRSWVRADATCQHHAPGRPVDDEAIEEGPGELASEQERDEFGKALWIAIVDAINPEDSPLESLALPPSPAAGGAIGCADSKATVMEPEPERHETKALTIG